MKNSPKQTDDYSRDGLTLIAFSLVGVAAWVAACWVLFALAYLMNHGH